MDYLEKCSCYSQHKSEVKWLFTLAWLRLPQALMQLLFSEMTQSTNSHGLNMRILSKIKPHRKTEQRKANILERIPHVFPWVRSCGGTQQGFVKNTSCCETVEQGFYKTATKNALHSWEAKKMEYQGSRNRIKHSKSQLDESQEIPEADFIPGLLYIKLL